MTEAARASQVRFRSSEQAAWQRGVLNWNQADKFTIVCLASGASCAPSLLNLAAICTAFVPGTDARVEVSLPSKDVVFESELEVVRQVFSSSKVYCAHDRARPVLARPFLSFVLL